MPKYPIAMVGMGCNKHYVGDEAQCMRGMLELSHPVYHGVVTNWDDMEMVL